MEISPYFNRSEDIRRPLTLLIDVKDEKSLFSALLCSVLGSLQIKLAENRLAGEKTVSLQVPRIYTQEGP